MCLPSRVLGLTLGTAFELFRTRFQLVLKRICLDQLDNHVRSTLEKF